MAQAFLISPSALINDLENLSSEIGKFSIALAVEAPYIASIGTSNSPIESFSILVSFLFNFLPDIECIHQNRLLQSIHLNQI